jgi:hypothetical protein
MVADLAVRCLCTVLYAFILETVATLKLACQVEVEVDFNLSRDCMSSCLDVY